MRRIEKQFTYPVWDEWRTDSFKQGRTGTHTYKGPEFITVEVNKDPTMKNMVKNLVGVMTRKEEFERPTGEDIMRITVDCKKILCFVKLLMTKDVKILLL